MSSFTTLVGQYKMKLAQFQPTSIEFKNEEDDIAQRKLIQKKLIDGFTSKIKPVRHPDAIERQKKVQERIRLFEKQAKFTQGAQELALNKREIEYLLKQLAETNVAVEPNNPKKATLDNAREKLTVQLATVDASIAKLQKDKQAAITQVLQEQVKNNPLPDKPGGFKKAEHTPAALAKQQMFLQLTAHRDEEQNRLEQGVPTDGQITLTQVDQMIKALSDNLSALNIAADLLRTHDLFDETTQALSLYADKKLGVRGNELMDRVRVLGPTLSAAKKSRKAEDLAALGGKKATDELRAISAGVAALLTDQQHAVQQIASREAKLKEQASRLKAVYPLLKAFLSRDPAGFSTAHETKLAKDTLRNVLRGLVNSNANLDLLAQAIELHSKKDALNAYLGKLRQVIDNDVVQGPFLLDKDNRLVQRKRDDADTDFFELTQSAQGDYNDPKNIGKYTYHVTALINILRTVDAGIATQGLSPGQGGKLGGSCEIADKTKDFSNTGVDIKEGSIVNSQNKVATSSNREEAMRVYIKQREDHVKEEMKAAKELDAAKDTATMLRFPIRAEYLGKFDKDPMHLTANLELLDGTPVPPSDIECLIHKEWIHITTPAFLATFKEMFQLV